MFHRSGVYQRRGAERHRPPAVVDVGRNNGHHGGRDDDDDGGHCMQQLMEADGAVRRRDV